MQSVRRNVTSLAGHVLKSAPSEEVVVLAWPLACGSAVAARTKALEFAEGMLRVSVPDAGWKAQLEAFSNQYCHKLSELCQVRVERISYEVGTATPSR